MGHGWGIKLPRNDVSSLHMTNRIAATWQKLPHFNPTSIHFVKRLNSLQMKTACSTGLPRNGISVITS